MSTEVGGVGLRERKRLATRRSIQLAAISLVRENGLERLTVDEIGRVADISPRTFFNYFPTKEAAIIGDPPSLPAGDSIAQFVSDTSGRSVIAGICALLVEPTELALEDHELVHSRRLVLKDHPHLFAMRMATLKHFEDELHAVVLQRLKHDKLRLSAEELDSRARLITLVAMATMRHAWASWADAGGSSDLAEKLRSSFAEVEHLLAPTAAR